MLGAAASLASMNALASAVRDDCDWRLVAVARVGLMFLFALGLALATGVRLALLRPATLWVRSLGGSASVFCTFYAVTHIPIADAITLMNVTPVWITLLSWAVFRDRPGPRVWAAVAMAVAGVALVAQPHFAAGSLGAAAAIGNSVFSAIALLGIHRVRGVDPWAIVIHFAGVSTAVSLAVLLATGGPGAFGGLEQARPLLLLGGVGLLGTLGQIFLTRAFILGSPPRVAVVGLTQILFAALFEILFWQRQWNALTVAGMALVTLPTAFLLLRETRM
jgi:drug/metabolite transporter (DMT)-like permease